MFDKLPEQYKALVIVALNTGLRKTEQLSLKWTDVDFRLEQIFVRESKSGKSRVVPMNQAVSECFRRLAKVRLLNNPYVFPGEKTGERQKDLPKSWERCLKESLIDDFHWHDLRHTFASRLNIAS